VRARARACANVRAHKHTPLHTPHQFNPTFVCTFLSSQRGALEEALRRLYITDAIDADGDITPLGRQMANMPLEPDLARALLAAHKLRWAAAGKLLGLGFGFAECHT
jgi:hypothetical protein